MDRNRRRFGWSLRPVRCQLSAAWQPSLPCCESDSKPSHFFQVKFPFQYAAATGAKKTLSAMLTAAGAPVLMLSQLDAQDEVGRTALMHAAAAGHTTAVLYLLQNGADPNMADDLGHTALHWAAAGDHTKVVKALLSHQAAVGAVAEHGYWPAHLCARNRTGKTLAILLQAYSSKAELHVADSFGLTPLHWAAYCGSVEMVKQLLKFGAPLQARDRSGRTAVLWAVSGGYQELVKLLCAEAVVRLDLTSLVFRCVRVKGTLTQCTNVFSFFCWFPAENSA